MSNEKAKALEMAISQIEKNFGKGSIMKMGEASKLHVEVISTGSIGLDSVLGVGGFPRGRIIEIFGPESGGKTTVSLQAIGAAQKQGGTAAFIDAEHSMDPLYAKKIGVDTQNLLISQPDYGEQALEICETLVRSNALDIIVIDSVAALVPKAEVEGEMGDSHIGLQARLMSQALRKLTAVVSKSKTVLIFINQLREKVGVMFGSPETTPGGRALKFYSSLRLDVRAQEKIKEGEKIIGTRVKIKVVKNKVAPPFTSTSFVLIHGEGISHEAELLDMGTNYDIVEKSGSWYAFEGEKLGQGYDASLKFLSEHSAISNKIETKIRQKIEEAKKTSEEKRSVATSSRTVATSSRKDIKKAVNQATA
ncbi:recombinase RecA [candidate division WOR-1 bacterium RIFOXYD2_FULL_36_8]|uniref:Protein RecA n=1 Tax=candidate division WOR-1 bacterium RIFOXYB2_FULL_36_35 TaxID=1802578 RepID=A0A1F4S5G9_UNCSA|nr:MAG: recombinase RecA [candidate division WOR-1 bacterium RIFOXYA2_FULL_36_21]OGC14993.1 MAG: recombinase RecA [candidate division WOR-1 bacterium RIFOXYB2_FULL_36_35]OGC18700.1 MAG: recombinase RecA [candidate division WOR-1 bacterium RIFOXYA12_FULL_36_13]OGC37428.1 MAG: recombinase RecA [candidate division WOR-1 bacterium RIFOXYD2_FULL_36_8]